MEKHISRQVFLTSFIIVVIVFGTALVFNVGLDTVRYGIMQDAIQDYDLRLSAYLVEESFISEFGGEQCSLLQKRIGSLTEEVNDIGQRLSTYSTKSIFLDEDFDYLKRRYFLSELQLFKLVRDFNAECEERFVPVVFFYSIDQELSVKQGFILDRLSKTTNDAVVVLSFDSGYEDEPVLKSLKQQFQVVQTPSLVIDEETYPGLISLGELRQLIVEENEDAFVVKNSR